MFVEAGASIGADICCRSDISTGATSVALNYFSTVVFSASYCRVIGAFIGSVDICYILSKYIF